MASQAAPSVPLINVFLKLVVVYGNLTVGSLLPNRPRLHILDPATAGADD